MSQNENQNAARSSGGGGGVGAIVLRPLSPTLAMPAEDDEQKLLRMWLHGRSPNTARSYAKSWRRFREFCDTPILSVGLADLQAFVDHLDLAVGKSGKVLTAGSRHTVMAGVRSLFAFVARLGLMPDIGKAIRMRGLRRTLSGRILSEDDTRRLIEAARPGRDEIILEVLYLCALRRSELAALTWADATPRDDVEGMGGQLEIFGKGNKSRPVLVPTETWGKLMGLRPARPASTPAALSSAMVGSSIPSSIASGGDAGQQATCSPQARIFPITAGQVWRIVKRTARAAGVKASTSPHVLRHCHATHALRAGVSLSVVMRTLGHANMSTTGEYLHAFPNESSGSVLRARRPT